MTQTGPPRHDGNERYDPQSGRGVHTHDYTPGGGGEAFPVGSVYVAVVATDPATLLGYGTWARIGQGRMLVGQDAADVDYDVAEETGGAKTHTHAGHAVHVVTQPSDHAAGATGVADVGATAKGTTASTGTLKAHTHPTSLLAHAGAGVNAHSAHDAPSSVPPYVVVFLWKRTV